MAARTTFFAPTYADKQRFKALTAEFAETEKAKPRLSHLVTTLNMIGDIWNSPYIIPSASTEDVIYHAIEKRLIEARAVELLSSQQEAKTHLKSLKLKTARIFLEVFADTQKDKIEALKDKVKGSQKIATKVHQEHQAAELLSFLSPSARQDAVHVIAERSTEESKESPDALSYDQRNIRTLSLAAIHLALNVLLIPIISKPCKELAKVLHERFSPDLLDAKVAIDADNIQYDDLKGFIGLLEDAANNHANTFFTKAEGELEASKIDIIKQIQNDKLSSTHFETPSQYSAFMFLALFQNRLSTILANPEILNNVLEAMDRDIEASLDFLPSNDDDLPTEQDIQAVAASASSIGLRR